jgi:hypothetical protein
MLNTFAQIAIGAAFIAPAQPAFVYTKIGERKYSTTYYTRGKAAEVVFTADPYEEVQEIDLE